MSLASSSARPRSASSTLFSGMMRSAAAYLPEVGPISYEAKPSASFHPDPPASLPPPGAAYLPHARKVSDKLACGVRERESVCVGEKKIGIETETERERE